MEKTGIVKESKKGEILVEIFDNTGDCMGCRLHAVCKPGSSGGIVRLPCDEIYRPGDRVVVEIPEGRTIGISFLLFILPLLVLTAAYFVCHALKLADPVAVLIALGFGAASFLSVVLLDKRFMRRAVIRRPE